MISREKLEELLKCEDDFLKFEQVASKLSARPDLHAFLLLEQLAPGTRGIIGAAEHDIIYLDVDLDVLCAHATEAQIADLRRCGVILDTTTESLAMYA